MHLPYAFQAKRMFPDVFRHDRTGTPIWDDVLVEIGEPPMMPSQKTKKNIEQFEKEMDAYRRAISKTPEYLHFHSNKIEKGQRASSLIGNQYTGSIFLALMSTLESDLEENAVDADCEARNGREPKNYWNYKFPKEKE